MSNKKTKLIMALTSLTMAIALSACGHEHEWERANCTEPRTCISCGETDGEPKGHDWIEATETSPKTCDRCGKTEGEPIATNEQTATDTPVVEQSLYERVGGKLYVGDEFTLGKYEQDNDLENGAEDIEWVVLEKTGGNEYLCISKYILDAQVFGKDNLEIRNRWSTSYLREWLNGSFYNTAFTDADARNLAEMSTTYYTWKSCTDTGKYKDTTKDMVRVLNYGELDEFPGCVKVSEYAKAQGAPVIDDGTREHENCSNGWYMMSYDVERVNLCIENYNAAVNPSYSLVQGTKGSTLSVAVYNHDRISISDTYFVNEALYESDRKSFLEGVRPVICVKLVQN